MRTQKKLGTIYAKYPESSPGFGQFLPSSELIDTPLRMALHICAYTHYSELDCLSLAMLSDLSYLFHFTNLQHIHIDFSSEGLHTQRTCLRKLLKCLPCELTSLELSYLPKIDVDLLNRVVKTFPRLIFLKLTCSERLINDCCWACYEESSSCTIHSPIPDNYIDADHLVVCLNLRLLLRPRHHHFGPLVCFRVRS